MDSWSSAAQNPKDDCAPHRRSEAKLCIVKRVPNGCTTSQTDLSISWSDVATRASEYSFCWLQGLIFNIDIFCRFKDICLIDETLYMAVLMWIRILTRLGPGADDLCVVAPAPVARLPFGLPLSRWRWRRFDLDGDLGRQELLAIQVHVSQVLAARRRGSGRLQATLCNSINSDVLKQPLSLTIFFDSRVKHAFIFVEEW